MSMDAKKLEQRQQEESDIRKAGATAVFNKFPQIAAKQLGMDTTGMAQPGQTPQAPPGTILDQTTIDESGNQVSKFVNPTQNPVSGGPSWGQQNKVAALKNGLIRGKVVIGREFGEPSEYPMGDEIMTMEHAFKAIQDAGLDPSLFREELALYDVISQQNIKKGTYKGKSIQTLRDGRTIFADTKQIVNLK
jgi:hypothetical protein